MKRKKEILPNEGSKIIYSTPMSEHQEGVSDPKSEEALARRNGRPTKETLAHNLTEEKPTYPLARTTKASEAHICRWDEIENLR